MIVLFALFFYFTCGERSVLHVAFLSGPSYICAWQLICLVCVHINTKFGVHLVEETSQRKILYHYLGMHAGYLPCGAPVQLAHFRMGHGCMLSCFLL